LKLREYLDTILNLLRDIRANQQPKGQRAVHHLVRVDSFGVHSTCSGHRAVTFARDWRFVTCLDCLKKCPDEKYRKVKITAEVPL
jgi:hypothetical protein